MISLCYCGGIFDLDEKIKKIQELTLQQEDSSTWSDRALSQKIGKEKKVLEEIVNQAQKLTLQLNDNEELFDLALAEKDFDTLNTIRTETQTLEKQVDDIEFKRMFSNPMDQKTCDLNPLQCDRQTLPPEQTPGHPRTTVESRCGLMNFHRFRLNEAFP